MKSTPLIGYPTLTVRNKDTGEVIKTITVKNTTTMSTESVFSVECENALVRDYSNSLLFKQFSDTQIFIYTSPFLKTKSKRFTAGLVKDVYTGSMYKIGDETPYTFTTIDPGTKSAKVETDNLGRINFVFTGKLDAPISLRRIGTVYLCISNGNAGVPNQDHPATFFTPLEEVIEQDPTMIVDIVYRIIVDTDDNDIAKSGKSLLASFCMKSPTWQNDYNNFTYKGIKGDYNLIPDSNPAEMYGNTTSILYSSSVGYNGYSINNIHTNSSKVSSMYTGNNNMWVLDAASGSKAMVLSYNSLNTCGDLVGSASNLSKHKSPCMTSTGSDKGISTVKSGQLLSYVYEKRRQANTPPKPFLDTALFKTGNASINIAATKKQKGIPERWSLDVIESGLAGVAKFKLRMGYTSSMLNNFPTQRYDNIPHLSCLNHGPIPGTQFDHPKGDLLTFEAVPYPIHTQTVLMIGRRAACLTGIANNKYVVLDETNLTPNNGKLKFIGFASDDARKEVIVACEDNGLYRITGDIDSETDPTIEKIEGFNHANAITTDGNGGVTVVTNGAIKFSKDHGRTWETILASEFVNPSGVFKTAEYLKSLYLVVTDFESSDFKTLLITSDTAGSGGLVYYWLSTSEKSGSGSVYTYGQMTGRAFQYKWYDGIVDKVRQFYTQVSYMDCPALDKIMSLMPQTNGYSKGGRFFVKIAPDVSGVNNGIYPNPVAYKSNLSEITNYRASRSLLEYTLSNKGDKIVMPWVSYSSSSFSTSPYGYPYSYSYGSQYLTGQIAILRDTQQLSQSPWMQYPVMVEQDIVAGDQISPSLTTNGLISLIRYKSYVQVNRDYKRHLEQGLTFDTFPIIRASVGSFYTGCPSNFNDDNNNIYIEYVKKPDGSLVPIQKYPEGEKTYTLAGTVNVDGISISFDQFESYVAGDLYQFIRYDGYINDNISTAVIRYEVTSNEKSEEATQSGVISAEAPLSVNKFWYMNGDAHVTRGGYIRSDYKSMHVNSPYYNSIVYGDFKLPIDLAGLTGSMFVEIGFGPQERSTSGPANKVLFVFTNANELTSYFITTQVTDTFNLAKSTRLMNSLQGKDKLYIEYDSVTRTCRLMNDGQQIATSGTHQSNMVPVSYISIGSYYQSVSAPEAVFLATTPVAELTQSGRVLQEQQTKFKIPQFSESNKKVLCTILGNKNLGTGVYDPRFLGFTKAGGDMLEIKINNRPASVYYDNYNPALKGCSFNSRMMLASESTSGLYDSNLQPGQVYINSYTGLVLFSTEDRGKPYSIKYKYFKDTHLGIDEVVND